MGQTFPEIGNASIWSLSLQSWRLCARTCVGTHRLARVVAVVPPRGRSDAITVPRRTL
jgi:hypothetical protein